MLSANQSVIQDDISFVSSAAQTEEAKNGGDSVVQAMMDLAKQVQELINKKHEPVELLRQLNQTLSMHFQEVWGTLKTGEQKDKLEFYKQVLKGTADKFLNEKQIANSNYLVQILRFFRNILVNFFPEDLGEESLAEIVHSLFNLDAHLYTMALQSGQTKKDLFISGNQVLATCIADSNSREINQDGLQLTPDQEELITLDQSRIIHELEWRKLLKVGDRLDVVISQIVSSNRASHWAPAVITMITSNYDFSGIPQDNETPLIGGQETDQKFYVQFDYMNDKDGSKMLTRDSVDIAPLGTYTDDFDWRANIQTGDMIDSMDSEGIWYRSTILDTRTSEVKIEFQNIEETMTQSVKEVYVAYRYYSEEEGHKTDEDGKKKYVGWSNKYDVWLPVSSPQIQKLCTVSRFYRVAGRSTMQYDLYGMQDDSDTLMNNKEFKVWAYSRQNHFQNLKCITDYINEFGSRGGFEKILDLLQSDKLTLKHLYFIMEFLSKITPLWTRQFAVHFIPRLKVIFDKAFTGPAIQTKFNREHFSGTQKAYVNILKRYYPTSPSSSFPKILDDNYHVISQNIAFIAGCQLLKAEKLELRVAGIKEISEQLKNTRFGMNRKGLSDRDLLAKLNEYNVLESVFGGSETHVQLVQRGDELLRFFVDQKEFNEKAIEIVWHAAQKGDEQTKFEFYKLLEGVATKMRNEEIAIIIEKFANQIQPEKFVRQELECVSKMTQFCQRMTQAILKACELFWDIACQVRPYPKEIIECAIDKLKDLIINQDREVKMKYISKSYDSLASHQASLQNIRIMQKILDQIPSYPVGSLPTSYQVSNDLIKTYMLITIVIEDLSLYSEKANSEWDRGIISKDNIDGVEMLNLPFTHRNNIHTRLAFIRQLLTLSMTPLNSEQLDQIWDILVTRSKITIDQHLFFDWFKSILLDNNHKISLDLMKNFFDTKVCMRTDEGAFKEMKKAGFDCIQHMFLTINEQEEKIHVISLPSSQANNQVKLDFSVLVPPSQLRGIETIWHILQDCDKKNLDLVTPLIDLITKLYHNLSEGISEDDMQMIQDQFCKECLHQMRVVSANPTTSEEDKKLFIKTTVIMIKSFLSDSERNGTANLRTHKALERGNFLEKIILQNQITQVKNIPRLVEINTYQNMTVWELKKIAAQKFRISARRVDLRRSDPKKDQFDDLSNSKLLKDLRVESYELIQVQKKPAVYQVRVPLLNQKKELVPEARNIFCQWFDRFAVNGVMEPAQCVEFVKFTTASTIELITEKDSRIVQFFNTYNKNCDGKLTQDEFLSFYREKAIEKPETVWNNLSHGKYGNDLKPIQDSNNPDDPRELKEMHRLPRCKLTSDQSLFSDLIEIVRTLPSSVQEEVWQLIIALRTNPVMYSNLLSLESIESLSKQDENLPELLYSLQIVDSFFNEFQTKQSCEIKSYFSSAQQEEEQFPTLIQSYEPSHNSNNERDIQAMAPESGSAIPMPPPMDHQIPQPPTQVPFIGPHLPPGGMSNQNSNNISSSEQVLEQMKKIHSLIEQFKHNTESEPISQDIIQDQEVASILGCPVDQVIDLKQTWVLRFVNAEGLKILLQILAKLNSNAQKQNKNELLKSKIEKECLIIILKIVKAMLMSTFLAKMPKPELVLGINRRMSSHVHDEEGKNGEEKKESNPVPIKKNQILADQENTAKLYEPLIEQMRGDAGDQTLAQLDVEALQSLILSILQLVLSKKSSILFDDRAIVDQGINTWISLILYNQDLLQQVYENKGVIDTSTASPIVKILIQDGLLCSNMGIRLIFRDAIKFLAERVTSPKLSEQPSNFFLRFLLQEVSITDNKHKESSQFFQLLKNLLRIYFDNRKLMGGQVELFKHKALLDQYYHRLVNYQSQERKGAACSDDHNLIGYLHLVQELIKNQPDCLTPDEQSLLASEILTKCLFTLEIQPLTEHITNGVDISASERPFLNKCQSNSSRKAAYQLLQSLCTINTSLIPAIITQFLYPILQKVKKPSRSGFQPRFDSRSCGYCGLKNLGCICYMNSMLQQFFIIPAFRYSLLSVQDGVAPNMQPFEGELVDDNVLHQMMKLMGFLELSERQDYNPREFCFSYKDPSGQPCNVRIQQDTQEFLNFSFDRLENHLSKTSQKYLLQNIFGGQTCAVMICKGCGHVRQSFENFYNLSLEVKNQRSIFDGLKRLTSGETINDYKCDACQNRCDVERKTVLHKLPNMLMIHLQRIVFDMDTFMNKKLNSSIEFPKVLNLQSFMMNEVLKGDKLTIKKAAKQAPISEIKPSQNEDAKQEDESEVINTTSTNAEIIQEEELDEDMTEEEPKENFEYKLVGVVLHMGTADAGHYLSYININRGEKDEENPEWLLTEKDKWLEFNDSNVKDYKFANLEADCFGGEGANYVSGEAMNDYSRNAYMLVYEKRRKEPIKIVIPSERVNEATLGCDSTAITRVKDIQEMCPEINPEKLKSAELHYDEEKKEHFALVDFNAVQKFVPNNIYQMVQQDNHTFLFERQIFNAGFFEAVKEMVETMLKNHPEVVTEANPESEALFNFMEKLLFDLLAMTTENRQLQDITKLYVQMLQANTAQTLSLIDRRILKRQAEAKDQKEFFELLVTSMDKDIRDICGMVLLTCVNKCFHANLEHIADEIMQKIFALIPEELSKNWLKIHQVTQFLQDLTRSGLKQLLYMQKNKLIVKLIDFFLENDSPSVTIGRGPRRQLMGSNYAHPPLDQVILAISYMARQQPYIDLSRMDPNVEDDGAGQLNAYGNLKWSHICLNFTQEKLPFLSYEDKYMLQQKAFIDKGLKSNYETFEFCRLMAHLSYENKEFSKKVAKRAIIGLNKANSDEWGPYISLITMLLSIHDSFMFLRFEWIMGIPIARIEKQNQMYLNNNAQPTPAFKMGVEVLNKASDDIVEYRSTLFKTSSGIKESFLQLLFQYRNRWPRFVIDCLIALFQACQNDTSGFLYHYLYTMDPPCYLYARFLDWVKPYLNDHIEMCLRNSSINSSKQELGLALQAGQLFDTLITKKPYSGELQRQNEAITQAIQAGTEIKSQSKKRPFQYDRLGADYGGEQYVIWNVISDSVIQQETYFDEQIQVTVHELQVRIGDSVPDGETNQVFPKNLFGNQPTQSSNRIVQFNNSSNQNPVGSAYSQGWGKNRTYGRGSGVYQAKKQGQLTVHTRRGGQDNFMNKRKKQQNKNSNGDFTLTPGKKSKLDNQDIEDNYRTDDDNKSQDDQSDHNSMDVEYGNDRTEEDNTFGKVDSPSPIHAGNNQEYQDGPGVNCGLGFVDPQDLDNSQSQNENPQGESNFMSHGIVPMIAQNEPASQPSQMMVMGNQEDSVMNENQAAEELPDSWESSIAAVRIYNVVNLDKFKAQKVTFKFNHKVPEGQALQQITANVKLPYSEVPFLIMGGKDRDCMILTKLRPFDDWTDYTWSIRFGNEEKVPELIPIHIPDDIAVDMPMIIDEEELNHIECPTCTFHNELSASTCDMCGCNLK